jgi:outer membrane protein TolC
MSSANSFAIPLRVDVRHPVSEGTQDGKVMAKMTSPWKRWLPLLFAWAVAGCEAMPGARTSPPVAPPIQQAANSAPRNEQSAVRWASFQTPAQGQPAPTSKPDELPFAESKVLSVESLVEQVLARNPSLEQMIAAHQAAEARYPQATSLDDPMFAAMAAPVSIGSNSVDFGGRLEISQKFPYPGKRALRGDVARAEAKAAAHSVDDMRLQLVEAARIAFYDLYLVERSIAVNEDGLKLMKELLENAQSRFKNGQAPEQDVDQAEIELGRQQERGMTLARMRKVSVARINTLLNLPPDAPLPLPPEKLPTADNLSGVESLRAAALAQRPDLQSLQARLAAEESTLAAAFREYYPDFEALAAYDSIMGNGPTRDLAWQLGVRINLPVRTDRRDGAIAEARSRVVQRRAELTGRVNQIAFEVQEAYEKLAESEKVVGLYDKVLIPAAQKNQKAEEAAYQNGKTPFFRLVEAKRNLIELRNRYHEANADYLRRRATLDRVVGGPPPTAAELPKAPR